MSELLKIKAIQIYNEQKKISGMPREKLLNFLAESFKNLPFIRQIVDRFLKQQETLKKCKSTKVNNEELIILHPSFFGQNQNTENLISIFIRILLRKRP